jgi:hypothetical protein
VYVWCIFSKEIEIEIKFPLVCMVGASLPKLGFGELHKKEKYFLKKKKKKN